MSAFKKNGKYYIRGKLKRDDESIYSYTKLAKSCNGIKEAREYERIFRKKWQDIQVSKNNISFEELSIEYMESQNNIKKVTKRTYQDLIDRINTYIGKKKINLITKKMLQNMITDLENKHASEYVQRFYYIARSIFNYAVDNEIIQINPISKIHVKLNKKDEVRKEMLFWEPNEFNIFIKKVDDEELKTLYIFLYYMGTRRGEALALQWKDVDFANDIVSIYKTVTYKIKGSPYEITSPKTKNSTRNIPMFKIVTDALKKWKDHCSNVYGFSEEFFVFGMYRPLAAERPRKIMIKTIEKINENKDNKEKINKIRIHDLRHSHASWLINNMGKYDFTDFDIAKRLGDTVEMLHHTYAHQFKGSGRNIIRSMESNDGKKENTLEQAENGKYNELKELKELLDLNIISNTEFKMKKKEILGI